MTTVLHLPAHTDVPIACDMSTARDTPDERLAEYGDLFERALLGRERRGEAAVLTFRGDARTRAQVEDLARREHLCCPFLDYRVETVGDEVIWTMTNIVVGQDRAAVDVVLDAFHALPEHASRR
jgi:hypothetical protein